MRWPDEPSGLVGEVRICGRGSARTGVVCGASLCPNRLYCLEGQMRVLITGGAGFIGHHVIHALLRYTNAEIVSLDRLDYSGNLNRLSRNAYKPNWDDIDGVATEIRHHCSMIQRIVDEVAK